MTLDAFVRSFRPLRDVLLVQVDPDQFETQQGLLIGHANIEQNEVRSGTVLSCGPTASNDGPMPYAPGDRVLFARGHAYVKRHFHVDGKRVELRIVKEEQLESVVIEGDGHVESRYVS